jgi:hypothetical protein
MARQIYELELATGEVTVVAKTIKRLRRRPWWHIFCIWRVREDAKKRYRRRVELPPPQRFQPLASDEIEARSVRPKTTRRLEPLQCGPVTEPMRL